MAETIWFTSDTHFHHTNILTLGKGRPFSTVMEMNEMLVKRWNERVNKSDRIYHLGDISFGNKETTLQTMSRLKGQIHIVRGNHDNEQTLKQLLRDQKNVISVKPYDEIKIGHLKIVLFHFPIIDWNWRYRGSWHLHGHCHGNLEFDNGPMLDVGVDCHNFAPIEFDTVASYLQTKQYVPRAHHKAKGE